MEISLLLVRSILSMAVMVLMGWAAAKKGILKPEDAGVISSVALYIVCPCMMITAFQVAFSPDKLAGLAIALAAAVAFHGLFVPLVRLVSKPLGLDGVEKASLVYSNCGNLIIPLVTSLLGPEYILYTSPYLTVVIVLSWTHCVRLVNPAAPLNLKKILFNPNILSCAVGLVLFFGSLRLPGVVSSAVNSVGLCVGPLGMFTIGMLLAQSDWSQVFNSRRNWAIVLGRLVVLPAVFILLLAACRVTVLFPGARQVLLVTVLALCAPVAVTIPQLDAMMGGGGYRAGLIVVLSVVLSVVTMPLMVLLYQLVC